MKDEVLIKAENVSKKFCRNFKLSLWYGMQDIFSTLMGKDHSQDELRKDEFWAVKDISFELRRGECLGLIGSNGAGKSTLLKMLNGLVNPDVGKITMHGRVGALIELGAGFNPLLTGRENIYNNGAVLGFTKSEINEKFDAIVDFSEIGDFIDTPVQNYSSGMRVRLGFAVASQLEPDILLIDEVLAVGDLGFVVKCLNKIGELIPNCVTIFVSHNMPMMARVSNKVLLMQNGQLKLWTNDISEGIKQYVEAFDSPTRLDHGNGVVELGEVNVFDPEKKEFVSNNSVVLKTDDTLEILINYRINSEVLDYEIFIILYDGQLREVLSSMSKADGIVFSNNDGQRSIQLIIKIPHLILATGRYSITIGASEGKGKQFLCRVSNATFFSMKANANAWACTIAPAEWKEI